MQNNHLKSSQDQEELSIDILEIFQSLYKGRWIISISSLLFSFFCLIYSFFLPNIYESKTLLNPVDPMSSISGALESFGGLASLAGIDIPQNNLNNASKALEKLNSLSFFENEILPEIFLPELMAVKSWNYKKNSLLFDSDIYDIDSESWVRKFSYPQKKIPSAQESFEEFHENHFDVSEDKLSGFVTLSIKHQSPFIAEKWSKLVVNKINSFYRDKDKLEAEIAIKYLNEQMLKTNFAEIKQALAELLKSEIQKLTLIEANELYVFDYIDPPAVMEEKAEPSRLLITIVGFLIGLIFGISFILFRFYKSKVLEK